MISLDEFRRLDLRIGEIVSAESMPGSTRLLRVEVDLAIASGLKKLKAHPHHE